MYFTCSLAGCHGNQTKDISSISTFLKFTNSLPIACKVLDYYGKGLRTPSQPPGMGRGCKRAWHGVKVSLPKSYHFADSSNSKLLVFKIVSNNITINDFKELLDFKKIDHAEAERMKSKRTGKDLSFIKIKCDNPKQAEALISGGLVCQKTGIIFRVEEYRTTP